MKNALKLIFAFFFLLVAHLIVVGQEKDISSPQAYIVIKNKVIEIPENDVDTKLPFTILYPKFFSGKERLAVSDADKINIIGKLNKPNETQHLYINEKEIDFSESGMFFEIVELAEGINKLKISVVTTYGQTIVVHFVIKFELK